MGQLTESGRQSLVSQGIVIGTVSVLASLTLLLAGIISIARADDILHFTSLIYLAVLQLVCGVSSVVAVAFVWWTVVGYRNRQLEIRSRYLDDNLTKGLIALFVPVFLNYSAFIVSVVFLIVKTETSSRHEMRNAMSLYTTDMKEKVFIDRLQIILRCCGSQSIMDWFLIDWQGPDLESGLRPSYNSSVDWDSVPFSCCCPEAPPPCIHQHLRVFGVSSLYGSGCAEKLDRAVLIFIITSLIMFLLCSMTMSLLMYSSRKLQTSARSAVLRGDATAPGQWWIFAPQCQAEDPKREEEPLLGMGEREEVLPVSTNATIAEFCFHQNKFRGNPDALCFQKSKIIDSTVNEDWGTYHSLSMEPELASSEEWPARISNGLSRSSSGSSLTTASVLCNYTAGAFQGTRSMTVFAGSIVWLPGGRDSQEMTPRAHRTGGRTFSVTGPSLRQLRAYCPQTKFSASTALISFVSVVAGHAAVSIFQLKIASSEFLKPFADGPNSRSTTPENDSRRSVSDTAVANLEVSHHFEHKIRPLYRT